jgi:hypothetical protein
MCNEGYLVHFSTNRLINCPDKSFQAVKNKKEKNKSLNYFKNSLDF